MRSTIPPILIIHSSRYFIHPSHIYDHRLPVPTYCLLLTPFSFYSLRYAPCSSRSALTATRHAPCALRSPHPNHPFIQYLSSTHPNHPNLSSIHPIILYLRPPTPSAMLYALCAMRTAIPPILIILFIHVFHPGIPYLSPPYSLLEFPSPPRAMRHALCATRYPPYLKISV